MINVVSLLLTLSAVQTMAQNDVAQPILESVSQQALAGDIRSLVNSLPDLKNLRDRDLVAYLKAVNVAAPTLREASDPEIRQASLEMFADVLQTRAPSEAAGAERYFRLKAEIIGGFCGLEDVRSNQECLLMIANFLGEIRSHRIPHYRNRFRKVVGTDILISAGVRDPSDLPTEELKDAYTKANKINDENRNLDALQLVLRSTDTSIMYKLNVYARKFSADTSENLDFHKELKKRGRLTSEEMRELGMPVQ